jgi:hypothetical protein
LTLVQLLRDAAKAFPVPARTARAGMEPEGVIDMTELNPQPLPPRSQVSVYVPTKALYDLDAMQQITRSVLDKLGCGGCHSGRILDFRELVEFTVNPKTLEVNEIGIGGF